MKIIQQNFLVISKIWFSVFFIPALWFSYSIFSDLANFFDLKTLFEKVGTLFMIYIVYFLSHIYEFKQKEIVVRPLFGLLGKKTYCFKDLKKVEYSISSRDVFDGIYLYFENNNYKKRITVSIYQVDLAKVKLFLYAHVENLDDIADVVYRKLA